ncbi:MAG: thiamine phosphate synthase [candidate division NC10 bacterium]|nr:thiamine phosphate synthase [candidate division NC10 bacterium]
MSSVDYSLYLVLDPELAPARPLTELAREAIEGGVSLLQLRYKGGKCREFLELAKRMKEISAEGRVPLIINDRLDIALAAGADGVHLGQEDLPPQEARRILGPQIILGVSAANLQEAQEAERAGASYLGLGSIFPTASKPDAGRPIGTEVIAEVSRAVHIPVVAIGGIQIDNVEEVIRKGASGVAVISALLQAPDIKKAAQQLKMAIERARAGGSSA